MVFRFLYRGGHLLCNWTSGPWTRLTQALALERKKSWDSGRNGKWDVRKSFSVVSCFQPATGCVTASKIQVLIRAVLLFSLRPASATSCQALHLLPSCSFLHWRTVLAALHRRCASCVRAKCCFFWPTVHSSHCRHLPWRPEDS